MRLGPGLGALLLIEGGLVTDLAGAALVAGVYLVQRVARPGPDAGLAVRGAD